MIFYGSKYALLQSCIVRYSVKLEFFMHVHGDHDGYSFDDSSAQSFTILVDMVPIVQDVRILAWWDYSDTVLQLSRFDNSRDPATDTVVIDDVLAFFALVFSVRRLATTA